MSALDPDSVENDMEESMGVLRPTYEVLAVLTMKLETLALADSATSNPLIPPATSSANVSCKLPDLELPVFKGQAFRFCGFWDQFEVAIHRNGSLSPNLGFRVNPKPPRLHTPPHPMFPTILLHYRKWYSTYSFLIYPIFSAKFVEIVAPFSNESQRE